MIFFVRALLVCLVLSIAPLSVFAQPAAIAPVTSNDVQSSLQVGVELEKQRQWIQAIQHYEESLRTHVNDPELKRRLLISRLHYDVVRRGTDVAIHAMIENVGEVEALELYSEVLARLETSYVEPIAMLEIVRSGTAYLEVALTEPSFVDRFLGNQTPEAIEHFRASIHKLTLAKRIHTRHEARDVVAAAARAAQQSLGVKPTATVMQFVFGAVGLLDPYSSFLSSNELNEVESQIEGNFVGLGIALQPHEVPLRILSVIAGGPALESGLEAGDAIEEIDSVACREVGAERAADMLRGPEQSQVKLLVARADGTRQEFVVVRRRVEVPSIEDVRLLEPATGVAYLKISSFQKTTAAELDEALWKLHRQGMQSLIVDLRGNPGGWLDASVAVADRFISEGGIVSTRGKNGIENQNYSATRSGTWQVPLVVLIDDQSASASEIFAGAIRDNRRGVLVGETSYGKGSVQGLFHTRSLSSGIRLTVSKFYSPSGRAISEQGVQPNIAVANEPADSSRFAQSNSLSTRVVAKPHIEPADSSRSAQSSSPSSRFVAKPSTAATPDRVLQVGIEQARNARLTAQVSRN